MGHVGRSRGGAGRGNLGRERVVVVGDESRNRREASSSVPGVAPVARGSAVESEWGGERKVMSRITQVALTCPKSH